MSQLNIFTNEASWKLNATNFSAPVHSEISSAQVKTMSMVFPIRVTQPDMRFSVQFTSETEYENFQRFVRRHQQQANLNAKLLTLNWPERNITNWTGIIKKFKAGGKRFNYAPRAEFVVDLVDSMVSQRMDLASLGNVDWQSIYGLGMGPDAVLKPPSAAEDARFGINPNTGTGPIGQQPGFGPGILSRGH